jgi:hypothetical protein
MVCSELTGSSKLVNLIGKRIVGSLIFTVVYLLAILSFNTFLKLHPEARNGILTLAIATTAVYAVGMITIIFYYKD